MTSCQTFLYVSANHRNGSFTPIKGPTTAQTTHQANRLGIISYFSLTRVKVRLCCMKTKLPTAALALEEPPVIASMPRDYTISNTILFRIIFMEYDILCGRNKLDFELTYGVGDRTGYQRSRYGKTALFSFYWLGHFPDLTR